MVEHLTKAYGTLDPGEKMVDGVVPFEEERRLRESLSKTRIESH
jgi:hypothetical protein